jgi:phosphatidylglycerophosphate synthase
MNLHRANKEGQWVNIPEKERNLSQKVASKTDGNITPANVVSVMGGITVLSGLKDIYKGKTKRGIVKIGVGRIGDLIDGTVAEKTGTKGPKGEAVDAGVDKALMAAAIPVLVKRDILPAPAAGLLLAQNAASAAIAMETKKQGETIHPSENGKKAVAAQWSVLGLYAMASAARKSHAPRLAESLEMAGLATLATATTLGAAAVFGYNHDLKNPTVEAAADALSGPRQR